MAENENVLTEQPAPAPSKKKSGKVKEWFRKKIVALKRKPQMIALFVLFVTTIFFMLSLFKLSYALSTCSGDYVKASGICQFVVTLLSLLVLVSMLNAFPKRKKPSIFFIVLVFVMIAAMLACDIVIYLETQYIYDPSISVDASDIAAIQPALPLLIGHMALLGLSAVVFALLPVYKPLINKINTKVELESATENMQGSIDIQED